MPARSTSTNKRSPDGDDSFVTGAVRGIDPNRVVTAILFTDIVGSTDTAARLGDRRWRELLDRYDAIVAAEVERFRGRLIETTTGDGALATFDGPAGRSAARVRCATPRERSTFSCAKASTLARSRE